MITLTREEAQQVLDALEYTADYDTSIILQKAAIETLRARLAQPEPEPVAWFSKRPDNTLAIKIVGKPTEGDWKPLYTAPPQREWQGLTDEDIGEVLEQVGGFNMNRHMFARAIEAKLKEKNT